MQLVDLRRVIDGNIILHVLAQDINELKPQKAKFFRTSITRLTLPDGTFGAIFPKARKDGYGDYDFVFTGSGAATKCVSSPLLNTKKLKPLHKRIAETWNAEIPLTGGSSALREAQKGAIFSLFGHWTSSQEIATVVMPTGTGKTEALLAVIAAKKVYNNNSRSYGFVTAASL